MKWDTIYLFIMIFIFFTVAYGQAVNGNWGDWQTWSSCSVTCLQGTRSRSRNCDNPAASGGGAACSGDDTETANCLIMNYCIPSYLGNTDLVSYRPFLRWVFSIFIFLFLTFKKFHYLKNVHDPLHSP
jgi:hypothetical protein